MHMGVMVAFALGFLAAEIITCAIWRKKLRKLNEELSEYKKRESLRDTMPLIVQREEADVVRIITQTVISEDDLAFRITDAGKHAGMILRREISKDILKMCDIKITDDLDMRSKVIRAELKVVAPKKTVSLDDLFQGTGQKRKGCESMVEFDICGGNPGAMRFLMAAYDVDMLKAEMAFRRMRDNGITGAKLYMLWNDCCGRDTRLALQIAQAAPIDKIVEHINYEGGRGFPFTAEELAGLC